ncbi:MAG: hypothetical protein ACOZHQ_01075 [Thermodesulfobacteriota bacterium]
MANPDPKFSTLRDLQLRVESLEMASSGSGGGDRTEARIAKLESDVENIKANISDIKADIRGLRDKIDMHFLITWGGLFFVALGLAGLMAKGFKWL